MLTSLHVVSPVDQRGEIVETCWLPVLWRHSLQVNFGFESKRVGVEEARLDEVEELVMNFVLQVVEQLPS
jgi:hypothetical protein